MSWSETEIFIQNLAHDLRQPLSEIEAIAYCLQTTLDAGRAKEMLGRIRNLVDMTSGMLSQALEGAHGLCTGLGRSAEITGPRVAPSGV